MVMLGIYIRLNKKYNNSRNNYERYAFICVLIKCGLVLYSTVFMISKKTYLIIMHLCLSNSCRTIKIPTVK